MSSRVVLEHRLTELLMKMEKSVSDNEVLQLEKEFHYVERLLIDYVSIKEKSVHN
ncbi:Uncharacterised protein [Mycobacteroides abscessus subsp. abscessus]|nr:Uncharacterised protein [Mycobacteroides abscessus subsp. abscessus]